MRKGSEEALFFMVEALSKVMTVRPATPINDSQFEVWGVRQHREKLEQVPIRVLEKERSSRHPRKYHRLRSRASRKVEWGDIRSPKTFRRSQQVWKIYSEGNVKA